MELRRLASQSDEQLVAQVRAGEDSAFEAIYDRYARGVLGFCGHMLGSRDEAEDALQLTFVSAYQALRSGDNGISLRPWLYTIARNRCLSELRARPHAVQMDEPVIDRACLDGPGVQVQRRAELRDLVDEIKRLPAEQRAALVLFELGDHSHAEIAEVLGVGREKVKALIFQAREALVRAREARDSSCAEVRERLATVRGKIPVRSTTRAHIDRCPSCKAFAHEVRRQQAALALILPVGLVGELKASVLSVVFTGGSGTVAAGAGASGGGGIVAAGASASGSGAVLSSGAAAAGSGTAGVGGGAVGTVAAGTGAASGLTGAGAAGGLASAGTSAGGLAVASAAPVTAVATGLTAGGTELAVAGGVAGAGSTAVVAKIVAAAAIATAVVGASHAAGPIPAPTTIVSTSPAIHRPPTASAASNPGAAKLPATPSSASTSGMTAGDARPNTPSPNTPEASPATNGSSTATEANPSTGGSTSTTTSGSTSAAGTSPATSGSTTAAGTDPSTGGSTTATTSGSTTGAGTGPATSGSTTAATGGLTTAATGGSTTAATGGSTTATTSGSTTATTSGSTTATTSGSTTATTSGSTTATTGGSTTAAGTSPTTSTTTGSAPGVPEAQTGQAQSDAAAPVEDAATQLGDEIAFIQASSVPARPKQTLTDKLSAANAALGAGDKKLAENDLDAALNYINARSGKAIPKTTATRLIADITRIKAAVG